MWPFSGATSADTLNFNEYDTMETGDALLFHGEGFWFSHLVEWATWSDFSHISMILKNPTYIDPKLEGIYMLESGEEKFPDAVEHRICFGVQIVNLKTVIENYTGNIYYRKLNVPEDLKNNFDNSLAQAWEKVKNLPYDDSIYDLLRVEFRLDWGDDKRLDSFFCSALQTFLYEEFELFKEAIPWDLVKPSDYDEGGKIETIFKDDVKLQTKIKLK